MITFNYSVNCLNKTAPIIGKKLLESLTHVLLQLQKKTKNLPTENRTLITNPKTINTLSIYVFETLTST